MNAISKSYSPQLTWAERRPSRGQMLPFLLFYVLICSPGFTNIASVNFSVALFPFVIYGYASAAKRTFSSLLPGARKTATLLLALLLVLCGWELVTAFGAELFVRAFRPLYGHASGLALVIAILALSRSPDDARRTRMVCMVVLTIGLAATHFIGDRGYGDRMPGLFKHPNQLGPIAAMTALFMFCGAIAGQGRKRLWSALSMVIAVYAILLSGSKTALVILAAMVFVSIILLALLRSDIRAAATEIYRNFVLALALVVIAGVALSITNERAYSVLTELTTSEEENVGDYRTVVARNELWEESIDMVKLHPLAGVGAGQLMRDGKTEHSHNVFMDAMRTTGIPGLALTAAFVLGVLWYVFSGYRAAQYLSKDPRSRMAVPGARGPLVGSLMSLVLYILTNQMSDSFGPSTIPFFYMFFAFSLTYFLPGGGLPTWGNPGEPERV